MERALRKITTRSKIVAKHGSGYTNLSNLQLAQEVQRFNGYNHFSNSGSSLLEEVVRRLTQEPATEQTRTTPPQPNPSLDNVDKKVIVYSVQLDPRAHDKSIWFKYLSEQLSTHKATEAEIVFLLDQFKLFHDLKAIADHTPRGSDIVIHWLIDGRAVWDYTRP